MLATCRANWLPADRPKTYEKTFFLVVFGVISPIGLVSWLGPLSGASWGHLGVSWAYLGVILGASWGSIGASRAALGASGGVWGVSWSH